MNNTHQTQDNKKLYILSCKKLHEKQQFVQGTHAAVQYAIDNELSRNPALVMLSCPEIDIWERRLQKLGIKYSKFHEPYYDNRLTAIACKDIGKLVQKLELI